MEVLIGKYHTFDQRAELLAELAKIPKDVYTFITLKKIDLGMIRESYHASISTSYVIEPKMSELKTDYKFTACRFDHDYKIFDNYDDAKNFLLKQIPKACHPYVTYKTRIVE